MRIYKTSRKRRLIKEKNLTFTGKFLSRYEEKNLFKSCFSRISMSHEEIGRTDRIYLSEDVFPESHHTKTSYYGVVLFLV